MVSAVSFSAGELRFGFTPLSGYTYVIESRADLVTGEWAEVPGTTTVGGGTPLELTLPMVLDQPQQFFRVTQSP